MIVLIPEAGELDALKRLMARLYSERRMDGDAMRDGAQAIEAILRTAVDLPDVGQLLTWSENWGIDRKRE